jgi:hypothetical protein
MFQVPMILFKCAELPLHVNISAVKSRKKEVLQTKPYLLFSSSSSWDFSAKSRSRSGKGLPEPAKSAVQCSNPSGALSSHSGASDRLSRLPINRRTQDLQLSTRVLYMKHAWARQISGVLVGVSGAVAHECCGYELPSF